jgi:hypothetical protein
VYVNAVATISPLLSPFYFACTKTRAAVLRFASAVLEGRKDLVVHRRLAPELVPPSLEAVRTVFGRQVICFRQIQLCLNHVFKL